MTQASNPLQLGQVLYPVLDATVIATRNGDDTPSYFRTVIDGGGVHAPAAVAMTGMDASSVVLDLKSCLDMSCNRLPVFVLGTSGDGATLSRFVGGAGGAAPVEDVFSVPAEGLVSIVGLDPTMLSGGTVLLLGSAASGAVLYAYDTATAALGAGLALGSGTPVGAVLVRHALRSHCVVALVDSAHQLTIADYGHGVLGATPQAPASAASVTLGSLWPGSSPALQATTLIAGNADQQLAVAYCDASGAHQLAVLGWSDANGFALLATLALDSATPAHGPAPTALSADMQGALQLVAADLCGAGTDQLILGYPATFGGVAGCAALLSVSMGASAGGYALTLVSSYAIANGAEQQPFASLGLRLAAGVFGGLAKAVVAESYFMGLVVLGCGATLQQLFNGTASVMATTVQLEPGTGRFPPLAPPNLPATPSTVTLATVGAANAQVFAIASDVTGQSVVLGPPVLEQITQAEQVLAIFQAPPGPSQVSAQSLIFTGTSDHQTGYTVSSNKTWTLTQNAGTRINLGDLSLGNSLTTTYGENFTHTADASQTMEVSVTENISTNDLVIGYSAGYDVWVYPVYRSASQSDPDGHLAVVFPQSGTPQLSYRTSTDASIGYVPPVQNNLLQSYPSSEADLPGYGGVPMFSLDSGEVSTQVGTQVIYTYTSVNTSQQDWSSTVTNSSGNNASLALSTHLFSYLPASFNFDLSKSKEFSNTQTQTTSLSLTRSVSITVNLGQVNPSQGGNYDYTVTPYVYQHQVLGCLMLAYLVSVSAGNSWATVPSAPCPCLFTVYNPVNDGAMLGGYSRQIGFVSAENGKVAVTLNVFNYANEAVPSLDAVLYICQPTVSGGALAIPADASPVTTVTATNMLPMTTYALQSEPLELQDGDFVSVSLNIQGNSAVFWGVYPPSRFASLDLQA